MHRAAGGFGTLNVWQRSVIAIPYSKPDGDFSLLIGDWYRKSHRVIISLSPTMLLFNYLLHFCWYHILKTYYTFEGIHWFSKKFLH